MATGPFELNVASGTRYAGEYDSSVGLNQHYWPEMVKHMEQTAPRRRLEKLEILGLVRLGDTTDAGATVEERPSKGRSSTVAPASVVCP